MSQFVVLKHFFEPPDDGSKNPLDHFDFMIEIEGSLATWRWPSLPAVGDTLQTIRLANHRLAYLEYEGAVSEGRGHVARIDRGDCKLEISEPDRIVAEVDGSILRGRFTAERIIPALPAKGDYWSVALSTIDAMRKMGPRGAKT